MTDDSLPDWRVEKSAISSLMRGHQVIFAGMDSETYHSNVFSKRYKINWTERSRRGIPFYWYSVKNQVKRIIMEVRPDIVHAHNIFSAKMMSELHLSFIYDDHEYWSEFSKILVHAIDQKIENKSSMPRKMLRKFARYLLKHNAVRLWTKWEKEVVSSVPTITVSEKIAAGLKMIGNTNNVFVLLDRYKRLKHNITEVELVSKRIDFTSAGYVEYKQGQMVSLDFQLSNKLA